MAIAIDGPAGAGKSTVAQAVAKALGFIYVDTGAMYRTVAWLAVKTGTPPDRVDALLALLAQHQVDFRATADGRLMPMVDGQALASELRTPQVSDMVSIIAVHAEVRQILTDWQQTFAEHHAVVMDGRDIGTVVLPHATVKVFLTASVEARAKRRLAELGGQGYETTFAEIADAIRHRDHRDSTRSVAPLRRAEDAIDIDSTGKSVEEVVREILNFVSQVQHGTH